MPAPVEFLTAADLRDILRGMAAVCLLHNECDHMFRLTGDVAAARWGDFAGNRCYFLFHPAGSVALGFDHESPMSPHAFCADGWHAWPGVYESTPGELLALIRTNPFAQFEPDFDPCEITFCLWNLTSTKVWQKADIVYPERAYGDPDGESYILGCVASYAKGFADEFRERYRWELDVRAVAELLSGDEITHDCLRRLKPDYAHAAVADLEAMGFRIT